MLMAPKKHLPEGTTWQQAYDAFGELARSEHEDVASAATEEQHLLEQIGGSDVKMVLEPEILVGFRRKFMDLLRLQDER